MSYKPLPKYLEVRKSDINGQGIFATESIAGGTCLGVSHIDIDAGNPDYIIRTPLGGFYNHSDTPNCDKCSEVFGNGAKAGMRYWYIVANRNIEKDEEITVRYTFYTI